MLVNHLKYIQTKHAYSPSHVEDIKLTTAVADESSVCNNNDKIIIDDSTLDGIETKASLETLKRKMLRCAKDLQFEQAAILRDKIRVIEEAV